MTTNRFLPHLDRMLALNTFIDQLPPKAFDLDCVFRPGDTSAPRSKHEPCGSVGCVAGWSPRVPEFERFKLEVNEIYFRSCLWEDTKEFDNAMAELFNLPSDDAHNLFTSSGTSSYDKDLDPDAGSKNSEKEGLKLYFKRVRHWCKLNGVPQELVLPLKRIKR